MPNTARTARRLGLLSLAKRMIDEDGLEEFSFRGLARAWGCSAPSLYEYFSSLDEILNTLREAEIDSFGKVLESVASQNGSPKETIASLIKAYVRHFEGEPGRYQLLFEYTSTQRETVGQELPKGSPYQILLDAMGRYGKALGCREDPSEEWAFAAWAYAHGVCTLTSKFLSPLASETDSLVNAGIEIFIEGLTKDAQRRSGPEAES